MYSIFCLQQTVAGSPPTKTHDPFRFGHKTPFFNTHHRPVHVTKSDATPSSNMDEGSDMMTQRRDVQFADDTGSGKLVANKGIIYEV